MFDYFIHNNTNFLFRDIYADDYHKNYIQLMSTLSVVNPSNISFDEFKSFISELNQKHRIYVIEDITQNEIVASITVLYETKIIHDLGKVCHIEDVVVSPKMQGYGFGLFMIDKIKTHNKDCYKIILDCSEPIAGFYEKCGFSAKGIQMAIYKSGETPSEETPEPPIRSRENHP